MIVGGVMATFDEDRGDTHRRDPSGCLAPILDLARIVMPLSASASGMLGVTRNAWRSSSVFRLPIASSSISRSPLLAIITGSTTRNGMSSSLDRRSDRFDDCSVGQHSGLGGVGADVGDDGFDLRADEIGRHGFEHRDAERVLCGDGGDRGGAVHAVRGERLEVGLNACAARRNRFRRWSARCAWR